MPTNIGISPILLDKGLQKTFIFCSNWTVFLYVNGVATRDGGEKSFNKKDIYKTLNLSGAFIMIIFLIDYFKKYLVIRINISIEIIN